jgi:hypothetical protein
MFSSGLLASGRELKTVVRIERTKHLMRDSSAAL